MARLFSNRNDHSYGGIRGLYSVANDICEMGCPLLHFQHGRFVLQPVSDQNDLDLLSTERQEEWDLKFRSLF
jgi:hypothetical protein